METLLRYALHHRQNCEAVVVSDPTPPFVGVFVGVDAMVEE